MDRPQVKLLFGDQPGGPTGAPAAALLRPRKLSSAAKTISDLYLADAEMGVLEAAGCNTLEALRTRLTDGLAHNSAETRLRNARFVIRWFFPDGLHGIAYKTWATYQDRKILADVLRCLYLSQEPVVGACVAECLFPIEVGMRAPASVFERFLATYYGEAPSKKTSQRVKTNLTKLGLLERLPGDDHRLLPINPRKTSLLILTHNLFAPDGPGAVELPRLLANPFWKYLGFKGEDEVRRAYREADAAGLLGKYVLADRLEQITTRWGLDDFLANKARL